MSRKPLNTATVCYVQRLELNLGKAAIRFEGLGLLQLCILLEFCYSSLSSALVAGRKIDKKRPVLERRLWILEGELAHNGKTDTLVVLTVVLDLNGAG
jgi:hypothetical protein